MDYELKLLIAVRMVFYFFVTLFSKFSMQYIHIDVYLTSMKKAHAVWALPTFYI